MKVYLTSTPEFDFDIVREVVLVLNETPGIVEFLFGEPMKSEQYSLVHKYMENIDEIDSLNFKEFNVLCQTYRTFKEIDHDHYLVMITSIRINDDWFSAFSGNNIFIYGEEWEEYTKSEVKYGIASQVVENIFQTNIGLNINDWENEPNIHNPSIGCINDFCYDKTDIMLKLRTADICESCMQRAFNNNIDKLLLDQILRLMDNLRVNFVRAMKMNSLVKPEQLHVDPERSVKIGKKDIKLDALNTVVFVFYLQNLQGVKTKLIGEYSSELKRIYLEVKDNPDFEVINRLVDPNSGNLRTVKRRLNKELVNQLGPKLAEYYILTRVEIRDSINLYKINLEEEYITIDPPRRR